MNICKRRGCNNPARLNPYRGHEPEYCSKRCKNIDKVDVLRTRRKQEAIDYLGGRCKRCGYNRCPAALAFHHVNGKSFGIHRGMTMAWKKIVKELDKCILLCANCHAEVHWEKIHGRVAQLEEHRFETPSVSGSIPLPSTL